MQKRIWGGRRKKSRGLSSHRIDARNKKRGMTEGETLRAGPKHHKAGRSEVVEVVVEVEMEKAVESMLGGQGGGVWSMMESAEPETRPKGVVKIDLRQGALRGRRRTLQASSKLQPRGPTQARHRYSRGRQIAEKALRRSFAPPGAEPRHRPSSKIRRIMRWPLS